MGKNSGIEWTHHTFNPWWGCAKVSDACLYCYAQSLGSDRHLAIKMTRSLANNINGCSSLDQSSPWQAIGDWTSDHPASAGGSGRTVPDPVALLIYVCD